MDWKKTVLSVASAVLLVLPSIASRAEALTPDQVCEKRKTTALRKYSLCVAKKMELARLGLVTGNFLSPCEQRRSAQLQRAGTCRFVDNGDGTITDLDLGLMWEQKTATNVEDLYDWATAASEHVSQINGSTPGLGNHPSLGIHNDWRLPSFGELLSTIKFNCPNEGTPPCVIDPIFLPIHSGAYWTIEGLPFSNDPTKATVVDYLLGLAFVERPKAEAHAVRLVRSLSKAY